LSHAVLTQDAIDLASFISNPYKFGKGGDEKVFEPEGVDEMISHINAAWSIDRHEMAQGSIGQAPDGSTAVGIPVWPKTDLKGRKILEDDNLIVELFPSKYGFLEHTYAYRFTAKPDGRVFAFGGDGTYSEGLAAAAKNADILFVEGITRKNVKFATWGGDTDFDRLSVLNEMIDEGIRNILLAQDGDLY